MVQGLTEFLPVSSSGHLVLAQYFLGLQPQFAFFLVLQAATLLATLLFFWPSFRGMAVDGVGALGDKRHGLSWRTIFAKRPDARLLWLTVLGSVPTAVIGLSLRHQLEASFGGGRADIRAVGWLLLVTAGLLLATLLRRGQGRGIGAMRVADALIIGLAQSLAFVPAISRSGATIAVGLLLGLDRELCARYSFVLSVPAIIATLMLEAATGQAYLVELAPLVSGFVTALLCGLAALAFLMPLVRHGRIYRFAGYVVPLALIVLWLVK